MAGEQHQHTQVGSTRGVRRVRCLWETISPGLHDHESGADPCPAPIITPMVESAFEWLTSVSKHGGPGPHKNGSLQAVHGGGDLSPSVIPWRPSMTRQEAEEWARDSAVKQPVTFVGRRKNVAIIKREGFHKIDFPTVEEARQALIDQNERWDEWRNRRQKLMNEASDRIRPEIADIVARQEAGEIDADTAYQMEIDAEAIRDTMLEEWLKANPEPTIESNRGKVSAGRVWGDGLYFGIADVEASDDWTPAYERERSNWQDRRDEAVATEIALEEDAYNAYIERKNFLDTMEFSGNREAYYDQIREAEKPYLQAKHRRYYAEQLWENDNPPPTLPLNLADPSIRMYAPMKTDYPDNYDAAREWQRDWSAVNRNWKAGLITADQFRQWEAENPEPQTGPVHAQAVLAKVNVTNPAVVNLPPHSFDGAEEVLGVQVPGWMEKFVAHEQAGMNRAQAISRALLDLGYDALVLTQYRYGPEDIVPDPNEPDEIGQGFNSSPGGPQVIVFDREKVTVITDESPRYMDEIYKRLARIAKHDGPGPHDNGSPQSVHGGGGTKTKSRPEPTAYNAALARIILDHPEVDDNRLRLTAERLLGGQDPRTLDKFSDLGRQMFENLVRGEMGLPARGTSRPMPTPAVRDPKQKTLPMEGLPTPPPTTRREPARLTGSDISEWMTDPSQEVMDLEDKRRTMEYEINALREERDRAFAETGDNRTDLFDRINDMERDLVHLESKITNLEYAEKELKPEIKALIEDIYSVTAGGLRTSINTWSVSEDEIEINGGIYAQDKGNNNDYTTRAGSFRRIFRNSEYGSGIEVEHDFLQVESEYRAQKFGDAFFLKSMEAYKRGDISRVKVHANIDVGGYAWAKRGFEWDSDSQSGLPMKVQSGLSKVVVAHDANQPGTRIFQEGSLSYSERMVILEDGTGYTIDYSDNIDQVFTEPEDLIQYMDGVILDETFEVMQNADGLMLAISDDNAYALVISNGTAQWLTLEDGRQMRDNAGINWSEVPDWEVPEWVPSDSWETATSTIDPPENPINEFTVEQARTWLFDSIKGEYDEVPSPYELAMWGADRPENRWDKPIWTPDSKPAKSVPMWPGKELMLGSDWYGVIEMEYWQ